MRAMQRFATGILAASISTAGFAAPTKPPAHAPADADSAWWPVAHVKARTIAISPDGVGPWQLLPDQIPAGALSPDGSKVAFLGSPNDEGFALFIADVTDETPHRKENIRQITPPRRSITQVRWTHDGKQIIFGSFDETESAVYIVDPEKGTAEADPRLLSAPGEHARDPRPGPDGRIAFRTVTRLAKPYPGELVVIDADGANRRILLENTGVSTLEWSPDGRHIACSAYGSLVILSTSDGTKHSLPFDRIDERFYAHYAPALAWRPDGQLLALRITFAGGTSSSLDPEAPRPTPFWDRKLFLVPMKDGRPDHATAAWVEAPDHIFEISWLLAADAVKSGEPMDVKD